jgi:hypothetical protein
MPRPREREPEREPPSTSAESASARGEAAPTARPPSEQGEGAVATGDARPDRFTTAGEAVVEGAAVQVGGPPLAEAERAVADGGVTTWLGDKRVSSLWSINQVRNSWVGISGVGWIKLSNASDSGIVALTMLASHARQMQTRFDYRQEGDGMIHEVYAW